MVIGPRALDPRYSCDGCPALTTESWKDYLENDETDSGTRARCSASGNRHITSYWNKATSPPKWCPAPTPSKTEPDAVRAALREMTAERDLLQDILDSRPAINAGLPETYVHWSQSIYSGEALRAALGSAKP